MKKEIGLLVLFTVLLGSALAELPSAPPPAPGGFEVSEEQEVVTTESSSVSTADASVQELQQKIASLEKELSEAKKDESELLSTPFIISLSINLTLLILVFYLFKKSREQAQY